MESFEVRLARLEEGMVSVKGDTAYIRKSLDGLKIDYWKEMIKLTGKVAGVAAITSLVTGFLTTIIAHAILH